MNEVSPAELTERIVQKATELGASAVGVADIEQLKASPSHRILPKIGMSLKVRWSDASGDAVHSEVQWPTEVASAVVIGIAHPADRPELDWYDGKGTPGNRALIAIATKLCQWVRDSFRFPTYHPPYFIESGGVFMKDAAVLAGLGTIGKNNLVITPEFGPRIRWRVLLLGGEAEATGPVEYHPCNGCDLRCRKACPVDAFEGVAYHAPTIGQVNLPGTDGMYDRVACNRKMMQDVEQAARALASTEQEARNLASTINAFEEAAVALPQRGAEPRYGVQYCRRCELSCPIGK